MPKVSVIIPCCNTEKYVGQCLDSLLAQTFTDFEVICVDDGSSDNTLNIINSYADADGRIRVFCQEHQGVGAARNYGLTAAQGEYVIFLDSDDFFDMRMLELACNAGAENNADIVAFGFCRFDDKKQRFAEKKELPKKKMLPAKKVFSALDISDHAFNFTSPAPWTKMFSRAFLEKTGLQFQMLPDSNDVYFVLSAISLAERICTVNEALVFRRVNSPSGVQDKKHENPLCFISAIKALYGYLQKNGLYDAFEKTFQAVAITLSNQNLRSAFTDEVRYEILKALSDEENLVLGFLGQSRDFYSDEATAEYAANVHNALMQYGITVNLTEKPETECIIPYRGDGDIKVSVIIPAYNTEDYIDECISSVCGQTLRETEIICISDGSTDKTTELMKKRAETDERISVYSHENAGLSCTRNAGIRVARGQYLYFMDSDDILDVNALELLYKKASDENLDVVYFDAAVFVDEPGLEEYAGKFNYRRSKSYDGVYRGQDLFGILYNNKEYFTIVCTQMLKTEYVRRNSFTFRPGIIHEDNAFTFEAMLMAERASHINIPFFKRRIRADSIMTGTVSFRNAYGYFASYQDMMRTYSGLEHTLSQENKSAALSRIAQNLHNAQTSFADMPKSELGRELGLGSDRRSFERLVVRSGNAFRMKEEFKKKEAVYKEEKNGLKKKNKKLTEKYNSLETQYGQLKEKYDALEKEYAELEKASKKTGRTVFQRFVICCMEKGFSYAVGVYARKFCGRFKGKQ